MLLDLLSYPFAELHYVSSLHRERQMGYKLKLHNLAPHWINGVMIFDMSPVWRRFHLNALGVNYFSIGSIINGISSRFDAESPYYQAWFGGYVVRFPEKRKWTITDHFKLAVADQKNWLQLYGMKNPLVEVDRSSVKNSGTITVSGYKGKLYQGNIRSNTDVGKGNNRLFLNIMMAGGAHHFNRNNSNLKLSYTNFIPSASQKELLPSYQKILLKGYIAQIPINDNTTALLYTNGAIYSDRNGKKYDTFSKIRNGLLSLMKKVQIIQAKK